MWNRRVLPMLTAQVTQPLKRESPSFNVSVLQYNILGGFLARPSYFPYCNPEFLNWPGRRQRILTEITHHNPDILCLEELTDYWTFFRTKLRSSSVVYDSAYVQRPSLHTGSRAGRRKRDGCGIFWKEHLYKAVTVESFNLPDRDYPPPPSSSSLLPYPASCRHDRVALAVVLQHLQTKHFLLVCNTHLYWDARKVDEQLEELRFLDKELSRLLWDLPDPNIAILLCGDFNNTPNSLVYKYLTTQLLGAKQNIAPGSKVLYGPNGVPLGGFPTPHDHDDPGPSHQQRLKLPILSSSYSDYKNLFDNKVTPGFDKLTEAPLTTVTDKRCCTIDYIFYNSSRMALSHLLEVPSETELRSEAPHKEYPAPDGLPPEQTGIPN
eukprot:Ihof_evm4s643 gene=Ihof_evmTU4s643